MSFKINFLKEEINVYLELKIVDVDKWKGNKIINKILLSQKY